MISAPKDLIANARYRRRLLQRCAVDEGFREEVYLRCSRDFVFWLDSFCWIYAPKDHPECPKRAFILYGYQETDSAKILAAFGKHDLLIEKTRDMGCTWLIIALLVWCWLFKTGQSFLLGSRKEEYVDKSGDPKSLFWKVDFLIENLPGWMRPNYNRTNMHLHNRDMDSTIDGESTNTDFARGDRRTVIALDEFPAVDNGYQILSATRDATNCRIFAGTPQGASGAYYDTRQKMAVTCPERILRMHWTLHPEKSAGLYTTDTGQEGGKLLKIDANYQFPANYRFILDGRKRSPWYDEQERRAANRQELAQEVDIDYAASGWQYFDAAMLERWKIDHARKPLFTGEILMKPDWKNPEWCEERNGGRVQLWFRPTADGKVPESWDDIACGCDIATGGGGEQTSNSVASFARKSTGEKICQFTTNQMFPSDFAAYVLALCKWFNNAYLVPERNGPGGEFVKKVIDEGYENVYHPPDNELRIASRRTRDIGFWTDKDSKKLLFADYRDALVAGTFINHCEEALTECGQYVFDGNRIEHSRAKATPDPSASGENHGDMCVADALACRGISDVAQIADETPPKPPPNSFLARRQAAQRERNKPRRWGEWRRTA